jgi:hypothetical protein
LINNDFVPSDINGPAGLTKREWFAGMALSLAHYWTLNGYKDAAKVCFEIADAMLAEGKK